MFYKLTSTEKRKGIKILQKTKNLARCKTETFRGSPTQNFYAQKRVKEM